MPQVLPNTTVADAYPAIGAGGAQLGIGDVFAFGYFVVANAAVIATFYYGPNGLQQTSQEIFLVPSTYPLAASRKNPLGGIKFRNAVAGTPAQVFGALYYPNDVSLVAGGEYTPTVSAAGGVTPAAGGSKPRLTVAWTGSVPLAVGPVATWEVPYNPDGSSSTFTLDRAMMRIESTGPAVTAATIERAAGGDIAFGAATTEASLSIAAGHYESVASPLAGTVASGELVRLNFSAIGAAGADYSATLVGTT